MSSVNSQGTQPSHRFLVPIIAALAMIGPFSIDTYLPAFPAIAADLGASQIEVQQTLTAYLLPFAIMTLWHGAIADRYGRRRTLLWGFAVYTLASLFCVLSTSIVMLWCSRALQGMSAGVGMIVGRAIIRDVFEGPRAQKQMASIALIFALAPAIAPILGGWIYAWFSWHAIFAFLVLFGASIWLAVFFFLKETLNPDHVQSLHPRQLWGSYREVFGNAAFFGLSAALGLIFNGMFIYILSAPVFIIEHLGLSPQSFAWLFIPNVSGMMVGAWWSGRHAGRRSPKQTLALAFAMMLLASLCNIALNLWMPPSLPWAILPLPLFTCGMGMAMPSLQLMALDIFPQKRGMASSCQGAIQTGINTLTAALIAPLLWASPLLLAGGMLGFTVLGCLMVILVRHRYS